MAVQLFDNQGGNEDAKGTAATLFNGLPERPNDSRKWLPYYLLDVFTNRQFGGNPLAVFPHADGLTDSQMQLIARELNLSETTFIRESLSDTCDCAVRIFTPKKEIPMAGHPTIGTAWTVLKHKLCVPRHDDYLVFEEGVGPVRVDYSIDEALFPSRIGNAPTVADVRRDDRRRGDRELRVAASIRH